MPSLTKIKGEVISGQELTLYENYFHDQSSHGYVTPEYLVFACSQEDVLKVVEYCRHQKKRLTIVGGRTGYSGGANSTGGVVLSLEKMNQVVSFNPKEAVITVEAGMVTDAISQVAEKEGLIYPVRFSASGSSQIGGNIATNAGGVHVVRYGPTRFQVLSLEVVTGRGDILKTNANLLKDNTGISLKDIFIGSEGKLGVITQATLRLVPKPQNLFTLVAGVSSYEAILPIFARARSFPLLHAFEFWDFSCYELMLKKVMPKPLFFKNYPYYLLAEWELLSKEAMEKFLEEVVQENLILDATYSETPSTQRHLWKWREGISEELKKNYMLLKYDISLPLSFQNQFINSLNLKLEKDFPQTRVFIFGHVGDGNLHVNIANLEKNPSIKDKIDHFVYQMVVNLGGSISAEHGIGKTKRAFYESFYPIHGFFNQKIQEIFDPQGIFR